MKNKHNIDNLIEHLKEIGLNNSNAKREKINVEIRNNFLKSMKKSYSDSMKMIKIYMQDNNLKDK
tara:strand:- start:251 stop:445 length:195 start_codon:yes stop_codon:yes gene_type:complete